MNRILIKMCITKLKAIIISIAHMALCFLFLMIVLNSSIDFDEITTYIGQFLKYLVIVILMISILLIIKDIYNLLLIINYIRVIGKVKDSDKIYNQPVCISVILGKYFERKEYKIGCRKLNYNGINEITKKIISDHLYEEVTVYINTNKIYIVE